MVNGEARSAVLHSTHQEYNILSVKASKEFCKHGWVDGGKWWHVPSELSHAIAESQRHFHSYTATQTDTDTDTDTGTDTYTDTD